MISVNTKVNAPIKTHPKSLFLNHKRLHKGKLNLLKMVTNLQEELNIINEIENLKLRDLIKQKSSIKTMFNTTQKFLKGSKFNFSLFKNKLHF